MTALRPYSEPVRTGVLLLLGLAIGYVAARWTGGTATRVQVALRPPAHGNQAAEARTPSDAPSGPKFTVSSIPELSVEAKRRIKARLSDAAAEYTKDQLRSGSNPFRPLAPARPAGATDHGVDADGDGQTTGELQLKFLGVLRTGPGEPLRAIVDFDDAPQCWIGTVGQWVEETPYRLISLDPDGRFAEFERISGKPGRVRIESEAERPAR